MNFCSLPSPPPWQLKNTANVSRDLVALSNVSCLGFLDYQEHDEVYFYFYLTTNVYSSLRNRDFEGAF